MLPMLARIGRRAQDVQRFGAGIDMRFPGDPVRYLQVLGVDPAVQRRGVGSALLREGLAAADTAGDDVYLETGRQANVAYYERHGFALVAPGEALWDGGPVLWRMRRSVTVR
jgi:ribosomal protein S18 acetylase RimI-like enzyme